MLLLLVLMTNELRLMLDLWWNVLLLNWWSVLILDGGMRLGRCIVRLYVVLIMLRSLVAVACKEMVFRQHSIRARHTATPR